MNIEVNWLGVILATLSSMVVGSIWYMPGVLGNTWSKLAKVDLKKMGANPVKAYGLTIVASFFTAFILAHMAILANKFYGNSFMYDAVMTAAWLWLGLTAARILVHDLFENRPTKLTVITVAHELVTLVVMGFVLGFFKP